MDAIDLLETERSLLIEDLRRAKTYADAAHLAVIIRRFDTAISLRKEVFILQRVA